MKAILKISLALASCLFFLSNQLIFAQPSNDECSGAIDISEAFMGSCGDFTFNGPFDLTGSTPGVDDPPEPGEQGVCPNETDPNLFGDDSEIWENSVWFVFTIPDLNGDGSPVPYSLWTTDGSFGDDCGINPNNVLSGDADTQVAIYEGTDCPNSSTGECDHFAANEDLFLVPPWISGWLSLEFIPGETYYMAIDGWDGVWGEFCLTVVLCGVECGDDSCAPVETYCDCEDCRETCPYSEFSAIDHTEDGNFRSPDFEGNIFVCSESVVGFDNGNVYMGLIANETTTCDGTIINLPIDLSVGSLLGSDADGIDTLAQGFFSYVELTPTDIAVGSITITSTSTDGLGNVCTSSVTLNFVDFPQSSDPFCFLSCLAGGVDTDLLDNGIIVCEGETFTLNTDGLEDLTLPCNSDDGSSYVYVWRVLADLYGTGDYAIITSWQVLGSNPTIDPTTFFIDEFGYAGPYYTPGYPILPNSVPIQIQGAVLCLNADGTIVDGCVAQNDGYASSNITVTYLPAGDPACGNPPIPGCIDANACNYDPNATIDDGSCTYPANPNVDCDGNCLVTIDCAGECGGIAEEDCEGTCAGTSNVGSACIAANGETGIYDAGCNCIPSTCEEEITGSISSPDLLCDLSGINIIITAPDGTSTTVTTGADGTFSVPGGPFPCGTYSAAFEDVNLLPSCYTDTGPTAPISFQVDGNSNTTDGPNFTGNPTIPTLSQWGLIVLALLLMSFGAIQLFVSLQKSVFE